MKTDFAQPPSPVTSFANKFQPQVTLNYIHPNGTEIRTKVVSENYSFSKDKCDVKIGDCYVKADLKHYEIYFKNEDAECSLTLDGSVPSWRPDSGHIYFGKKDFIKDSYTKRHVAKTLRYNYKDDKIHYRITYKKGNEEVERQVMKDIVGQPLAAIFYLFGFRGSYHRMGGTVVLEKLENGKVVEKIEAPAMWEQMCFKPDRIK